MVWRMHTLPYYHHYHYHYHKGRVMIMFLYIATGCFTQSLMIGSMKNKVFILAEAKKGETEKDYKY